MPILVATNYRNSSTDIKMSIYDDRVVNPLVTGKAGLANLVTEVINKFPNETPVNPNWIISPYAPTPTIIEAAKALYENHSVENITRHEADKVTTDRTIAYILDVIQKSKENQQKSICFVTGVPGAGKTLVGLDVAIKQTYQGNDNPVQDEGAVYLSGNGPLVAVLTEALAQDNYKKCRENGEKKKMTDSRREVKAYVACSSIREKIDNNNGFLLCANHDKLFDRFLITFDARTGRIKISSTLSDEEKAVCMLDSEYKLPGELLTMERRRYLIWHNNEFEKKARGD